MLFSAKRQFLTSAQSANVKKTDLLLFDGSVSLHLSLRFNFSVLASWTGIAVVIALIARGGGGSGELIMLNLVNDGIERV